MSIFFATIVPFPPRNIPTIPKKDLIKITTLNDLHTRTDTRIQDTPNTRNRKL